MTDKSIDLSVVNLYNIWRLYRKGKKRNNEMDEFEYELEINLMELSKDLQNGTYIHGGYRQFEISEGKKRLVSVASVRDRLVHRLIYEYLVEVLDKKINFDAWSGRKKKGLLGAIRRTQLFAKKYKSFWVVKVDIKKFFDSVDHRYLISQIDLMIKSGVVRNLCEIVVRSFETESNRGMPIGNVTSQIFAHLYLIEVDEFLSQNKEVFSFVRYGDDIVIFVRSESIAEEIKNILERNFESVCLKINHKSSYICRVRKGIRFLGCIIYPRGRDLQKQVLNKIKNRMNSRSIASYTELLIKHSKHERLFVVYY